ncbi:hypothetical protein VOLCADRAFT_91672 [Volvox carteri f. nagariensis]|uniref:Nucleotide-diphospho-sugar transferase domain-containing protein n=1 Tax=Volvox carteri f. nagariensis TaxID=3068 RepID=D8TXP5_VOLCA|nr:uncharacterized protein VOLCADRAFT_91672 [Volvox carteri f. nagariensis]EFJ47677.1 hypothetical protein VOLCADRAFT_91672 [Volvox carteri f. nagariensis]|eukprot:XP_002951148.1 hypothetical protein VOLCADRAFT_91672 [Volvox carteri f. nagariensis]
MPSRRIEKSAAAWLLVWLATARFVWAVEAEGRDGSRLPFDNAFVQDFWADMGARLPTREFVEAVQAASLGVIDGQNRLRRLVILSLDHLANHLVANVMSSKRSSTDKCNEMSKPYGARCVAMTSSIFGMENFDYKSLAFYGLSFAKVLTILDALSLGVHVLVLDGDQVFFRNPLPYIVARDIDILVTGDCGARDDVTPAVQFPKINSNIGLIYFRATAMVTRAVMQWLAFLANRAKDMSPMLDQSSFGGVMERTSVPVGVEHLSLGMLVPDHFPHRCMGPCGCDTDGVRLGEKGKKLYRVPNTTCAAVHVRKWYHFHVPCSGDMNVKARALEQLLTIYETLVGPVNSLSSPLDVP